MSTISSKPGISIVGYGRVGLPLGRVLQERGYSVTGTVTSDEKCQQLNAEGLSASLLRFMPEAEGDLAAAFGNDVLVVTVPPSMNPEISFQSTMDNIADAAVKGGVKKVLMISATSVYKQTDEEVREEDATHEASPFLGTSWLKIEEAFTQRSEFKTTVVRFSGLMGGDTNPGKYVAGRELKGADVPVNMIHIDDCVEIMAQIIEQDVWGEAFNASADEHPSKRDFYTKACTVAGIPVPVFVDETAPYRIVNCDKLKQRLGYTFKYSDPMQGF